MPDLISKAEKKVDSKENAATGSKGQIPVISLPKGGGAIRDIGEKFAANPVTGTGSMTVPIFTSPGRAGFGPQLSLAYDSGAGNGPFGLGWNLSLPQITRKTDKGLPKYQDAEETDVFIFSGAEDLVPVYKKDTDGKWKLDAKGNFVVDEESRDGYKVRCYLPRIEGLFARIERWTRSDGDVHWRSISKDNILTVYGRDEFSRIVDPADPRRIFSWLICESYDDKGNAIVYEYKPEDDQGVDRSQANERNRLRTANRYLKHIKYGNQKPILLDTTKPGYRASHLPKPDFDSEKWMFEVVFDYLTDEKDKAVYGQHYKLLAPDSQGQLLVEASTTNLRQWNVRPDPFSSYRAGFEVRTYRLCSRVLMFHHFSELETEDYLVRSTEFNYTEGAIAAFITAVSQSGYKFLEDKSAFLKKSLPLVEFEYSQATIDETVREIDTESLENLPAGVDDSHYQWVDLDGEGISGILTEQGGTWFYKRNLSANSAVDDNGTEYIVPRFGPLELVAVKPNTTLSAGQAQFLDLAGNGQLDLVEFSGSVPGFYERTKDRGWEPFRAFRSLPNIPWNDPNLKFVDLNGDGHADILLAEHEVFTWYPSLAEVGFGQAERSRQVFDEEQGPHLVFADSTQSVYLADLSGDGLSDLVRIRNGEVCYWPNLGYGKFGAKVTMDKPPWFDTPDLFDQKRIRLADIDGSGTTDIIYLNHSRVAIYHNECGNRWSGPEYLNSFPPIDNFSSVMATDLLGNGTACLVWSSLLPGSSHRPMCYIDLMGGQKPHLLIAMKNNLGAETCVQYAPSTKFYLQDKLKGIPWITRLPFPVHVVERVETYDRISQNRFVTRYAYHHGFYDGIEREFRGFGLVEQWDTEEFAALCENGTLPLVANLDAASHVPPVYTKTWFHTGAYFEGTKITGHFATEYYQEPNLTPEQLQAMLLDDTVLPAGLSAEEEREACRTLKGSVLRQEVYAEDNTAKSKYPYSVSERNYTVERLQPQAGNSHAVFFLHPREMIDYHYEREVLKLDPNGPNSSEGADPRVNYQMILKVDEYGNVERAVTIGYPRRAASGHQPEQAETHLIFTVGRFANYTDQHDWYRVGLPVETRTYEIVKPPQPTVTAAFVQLFTFAEMQALTESLFPLDKIEPDAAKTWPYEKWNWRKGADTPLEPRLRLIEHVRTLYRKNDLTGPLPPGEAESLALPYDSYKLAFTPGLLSQVFGPRVNDALLQDEGKYVRCAGSADWWISAEQIFLSPGIADTPGQELAFAQQHFFLPHRFLDPFGNKARVYYDPYNLLMTQTIDPVGNVVQAQYDYRLLQPKLVTDPNGNRTEAAFDALGLVVGTAVMGKVGENKGDSLAGFEADLAQSEIDAFFTNPKGAIAATLLSSATTRIIYDVTRYARLQTTGKPVFAAALARETHISDPLPPDGLRLQVDFSYSDGFGREIQKKIQAEAGPVEEGGTVVNQRWAGSGWTIFNNKGKPVKQYEPFFTATHDFEFAKQHGVSSTLFYDPVGRVVATLHPNHTYEKGAFDPWRQETWDVNDTVLEADPKADPDVGGFFRRLSEADYLPTWHESRKNGQQGAAEQAAAQKTAAHADTPSVAHLDALGRTFLTIVNNGAAGKYETRVELDSEGNQRAVIDAKQREVMRYDYDMLGNKIKQVSMDAGTRWMLNDVAGKPLRGWDSRSHEFSYMYDALQRPLEMRVKGGDGPAPLDNVYEKIIYGEGQSLNGKTDQDLNLRGKPFMHYDTGGKVQFVECDFKGNLLKSYRQLAKDYKEVIQWDVDNPDALLENEKFTAAMEYDALNRVTQSTTPDGSITRPTYNEASLLEKVRVEQNGTQTDFVKDINYDAKGQRKDITYDNGIKTTYHYDRETFRLTHLETKKANGELRQDIYYAYDPVGNITRLEDRARPRVFFGNVETEPVNEFTYDALYRLTDATGREHIAQVDFGGEDNWNDLPFLKKYSAQNPMAWRNYTQQYQYDSVGNIKQMKHIANGDSWTRDYAYETINNRLKSTTVGNDTYLYPHHPQHGFMEAMPHLQVMRWNFKDELQVVARQCRTDGGTPETTYYVYDAAGQRIRKVTEYATDAGDIPVRKDERIYVGGIEIYREYTGSHAGLERKTLHVMDDKSRIAMVETRNDVDDGSPAKLVRYQFSNHLGTACLETDEHGRVISYEEYHPYGTTSYQAVDKDIKAAAKRFRYTGKERDEETGFYYHGARHYAPWLGRWTAADPVGLVDGVNLYSYVSENPVKYNDPKGLQQTGGDKKPEITYRPEDFPLLGSQQAPYIPEDFPLLGSPEAPYVPEDFPLVGKAEEYKSFPYDVEDLPLVGDPPVDYVYNSNYVDYEYNPNYVDLDLTKTIWESDRDIIDEIAKSPTIKQGSPDDLHGDVMAAWRGYRDSDSIRTGFHFGGRVEFMGTEAVPKLPVGLRGSGMAELHIAYDHPMLGTEDHLRICSRKKVYFAPLGNVGQGKGLVFSIAEGNDLLQNTDGWERTSKTGVGVGPVTFSSGILKENGVGEVSLSFAPGFSFGPKITLAERVTCWDPSSDEGPTLGAVLLNMLPY